MDVRMSMGFFSMHVAGRALLSFSSLLGRRGGDPCPS